MGFFEPSALGEEGGGGGGGKEHEGPIITVVYAPMIMKFGTVMKLDVFHTVVTNKL